MNEQTKTQPDYDVVIIGAGLSGIGAAYHLQDKCPERSFTVLEGRDSIGGTWDLFKYPGIRSDSDMYTLGFPFNPWKDPKAIADGPSILQYIKDTAAKFGIDEKIKFNHMVSKASWSEGDGHWTLEVKAHKSVSERIIRAKFIFMCSGYYDYENGYQPAFPAQDEFKGTILHPQKWDTDLDYTDKNVVIIGSGATAVTLAPEMSKKAKKVTMLQRSPTYIMNLPSEDIIANTLRKILPSHTAHQMSRWKNILVSLSFYKLSRRYPERIKRLLMNSIKKTLGDNFDAKHFNPKYDPWDQRLCLVPNNDLFNAINEKKVAIVTNSIKQFTPNGILLDSGETLDAEIIVTATGLKVKLLGGLDLETNGKKINSGELHCYRGVMFDGIPNFAFAVGYTNASWTLKCDLNCHFVAKVLNHMRKNNLSICTPRFDSAKFETEPLLDFDSGYIKRAADIMPKQGSKAPWKVYQNYLRDLFSLKYSAAKDDYLEYK